MQKMDPANLFENVLKRANEGDLVAACEIAHRYRLGMGIHRSWPEALRWYTVAADAGDMSALNWLVRLYGGREEMAPEPEKAIDWLNKAVEAGDTGSLCDLGLHFFNGWGVQANQKHAAELYKQAARAGDLWGAYLLGLCYQEGQGVKKNRRWALQWLDMAADEHQEARDMAYVIRYGDEG